jgi:SAM-dependent methyltransferase
MDAYLTANQALWNSWTPFHVASGFYDVEGFKAGRETLDPIALAGLSPVRGKSLLHLQCHFGLDTLSWARRGARVTGADFSAAAIKTASALARETGIAATFVHSDLYDLPQHLAGQFDRVFTSHGVLPWLPDLDGWARVIAHFLKPGGLFFIVEAHPVVFMFDDQRPDTALRLRYPYFHQHVPLQVEEKGSYAVPDAPIHGVAYYWFHSLADILGALLRADLRLISFDEYPFMRWAYFPWMERRADGWWQLPPGTGDIPLMFSLRAMKGVG